MSETAPREVGSVSPVRFTGAASGSPSSPGRREVSPEGTTTAPGFPPLAATPAQGPAHSGPRCAGLPAVAGPVAEFAAAAAALADWERRKRDMLSPATTSAPYGKHCVICGSTSHQTWEH